MLDLAEGLVETYQDLASEIEPTYAGPVDGNVYLHRSIHPAEVIAFDLESGQTTPIDNGSNPAVTDDGRFLAYVAGGGAATDQGDIVVRDLVSGSERRFMTRGAPGTFVTISHLSWSSDGRRLAFLRGEDGREGQPNASSQREIRLLDPDRDTDLDSLPSPGPSDPDVGWTMPTFRGRLGTLLVVEQSKSEADGRSRVLEVDPATGAVLATLFEVEQPIRSLDSDASGFHLLYSFEEPRADPAEGHKLTLESWSSGEQRTVGDGLTAGAWQ